MITFPSPAVRCFIAAAILGALSATSTASAADPRPVSVTVKYADLNLASPTGARVLYGRIRAAAQNGCDYFWFKTDSDEAQCLQSAIASAVTRINRSLLTAEYNQKYKIQAPDALVSQSR